ncbi:hypothetical protein DICVIV_13887, partial [Dictyocaulus viviparus]
MSHTLSSRLGSLTKAINRLNASLDHYSNEVSTQLVIPDEESRRMELVITRKDALKEAISIITKHRDSVQAALENYTAAADSCEERTKTPEKLKQDTKTTIDKALEQLDKAEDYLSQLMTIQIKLENASSKDNSCSTQEKIGLPPIPIPKFNGRVWEWEAFWGAFNHTIHSKNIDDITKMNYLLDALQGEAKEFIKHYEVSQESYQIAISHLREKYGNGQAIISQLLHRLRTTQLHVNTIELDTKQNEQSLILQTKTGQASGAQILAGQALIFNHNEDKKEIVQIILDTGSDHSFITKRLASHLELEDEDCIELTIQAFETKPKKKECGVATLKLQDAYGQKHDITVMKVDNITPPLKRCKLDQVDRDFLDHHNVKLSINPDSSMIKPELLLGCQDSLNLLDDRSKMNITLPSGIKLITSRLGYLVTGGHSRHMDTPDESTQTKTTVIERKSEHETRTTKPLDAQEFMGPEQQERELQNDVIWQQFQTTIQKREDGYYVRLPWKSNASTLPDNKSMAVKRLQSMLARLEETPEKNIPEICSTSSKPFITAQEYEMALRVLVRNHQNTHYPNYSSKLVINLSIYQDNHGTLRCKGRIGNADIPFETQEPMLVIPNTPLAEVLVNEAHLPFHCSTSQTIANVRRRFWIPCLRRMARKAVRKCLQCQKMNNLPYKYPDMDNLPAVR